GCATQSRFLMEAFASDAVLLRLRALVTMPSTSALSCCSRLLLRFAMRSPFESPSSEEFGCLIIDHMRCRQCERYTVRHRLHSSLTSTSGASTVYPPERF